MELAGATPAIWQLILLIVGLPFFIWVSYRQRKYFGRSIVAFFFCVALLFAGLFPPATLEMQKSVFIQPDFSWLILLLGIPILILLANRSQFILAGLIFIFCMCVLFWGHNSEIRPAIFVEASHREINDHAVENSDESPRLTEHGSSLDALWQKLNESKIDLTQNTAEEAEPTLEASDKEATEAVAESSGLSAEGQLPPRWVVTPPKAIGNVYRVSVASDPFVTVDECRKQLETEFLPRIVGRRIEQLASGDVGHPVKVDSPLPLGIGLDYIFREICVDEFTGTVDSSVGEMRKVHVLLEFNESVDRELRSAWLQYERNTRLEVFGIFGLFAIAALAAVYGLLRIDTWTRGYYSQQLLWGSAVAIIAIVFLLVN